MRTARFWVQTLVKRFAAEGRRPTSRARDGRTVIRARSAWRSRTRSCGSARCRPGTAWTLIDDLHIRDHRPPHRPADPRTHPRPEPGLPIPRPTPGPLKKTPTTPRPASRSRPNAPPQPESRLAEGRLKGPGLDPDEDGATINAGMPKHPPNATMSRHTCQRCPETSQGGAKGTRTPNPLLANPP